MNADNLIQFLVIVDSNKMLVAIVCQIDASLLLNISAEMAVLNLDGLVIINQDVTVRGQVHWTISRNGMER